MLSLWLLLSKNNSVTQYQHRNKGTSLGIAEWGFLLGVCGAALIGHCRTEFFLECSLRQPLSEW